MVIYEAVILQIQKLKLMWKTTTTEKINRFNTFTHQLNTQILTFNGGDLKYWPFVRAFDNVLAKDTLKNKAKFILVQSYTQDARKVIKPCL